MKGYFEDSSKFVRDYIGFNGKGAKMLAENTVKHMEDAFYNDEIIFEGDGAMKWKSSGNYLPEDCAEAMRYVDISKADETQLAYIRNASIEATARRREKQTEEFLNDYRERNKNRVLSAEERYEMECAFGKGTKVVDVITGQVFAL